MVFVPDPAGLNGPQETSVWVKRFDMKITNAAKQRGINLRTVSCRYVDGRLGDAVLTPEQREKFSDCLVAYTDDLDYELPQEVQGFIEDRMLVADSPKMLWLAPLSIPAFPIDQGWRNCPFWHVLTRCVGTSRFDRPGLNDQWEIQIQHAVTEVLGHTRCPDAQARSCPGKRVEGAAVQDAGGEKQSVLGQLFGFFRKSASA